MSSPRISPPPSPSRLQRGSEVAGRTLVAAWEVSGLSQAAFARRRGVSAQRLSYWRHRLDQRGQATSDAAGFVEIPSASSSAPVSPGVAVELTGGIRIHVERGFDPVVLRAVVSALAGPVPSC